jgi:hypothetical protein
MKKLHVRVGFKNKPSPGGYYHIALLAISVAKDGFAIHLLNFFLSIYHDGNNS